MQKSVLAIASLFVALSISASAHATPIVYAATLAGSNEVPPNASTATGSGKFTLDAIANTLKIELTFLNLTAPASAGHIHCCVPAGVATGVAVPFVGLPAALSGTYTNTVDLSATSTYTIAFLTAHGGTAAGAEAALIAGLNTGNTYANIHDLPTFGGGEIRGQIAPTPEPSSLLLLGTGLIGIVETIRRRARSLS